MYDELIKRGEQD
jgi:intraflagellar transport protein 56